jgi:hypothetical protein
VPALANNVTKGISSFINASIAMHC